VRVVAHIATPGEPSLTLVTPSRHVPVGTFEDVEGLPVVNSWCEPLAAGDD
jgi:hypothetical protein